MEKKIEEQLKRLPKYIEDSGTKYFLEPGIIGDDFDVVVIDYVDNKSIYRDLLFSVENTAIAPFDFSGVAISKTENPFLCASLVSGVW